MSEREKLVDLLDEAHDDYYKTFDPTRNFYETIADYLIANGVVVLPVQPEQEVYDTSDFSDGTPAPEVYDLSYPYVEVAIDHENGGYRFVYDSVNIKHSDIGKTIFFTEEEARAALMG